MEFGASISLLGTLWLHPTVKTCFIGYLVSKWANEWVAGPTMDGWTVSGCNRPSANSDKDEPQQPHGPERDQGLEAGWTFVVQICKELPRKKQSNCVFMSLEKLNMYPEKQFLCRIRSVCCQITGRGSEFYYFLLQIEKLHFVLCEIGVELLLC